LKSSTGLARKGLIAHTGSVIMSLALKLFIKKAPLFFVALFLCTIAHADDWDSALKRAKREDKPVVLYFFTTYCSYCQAMDKEVLAEKEVSTALKKNAVYLRIDVEKREDLARFYGVRGYPTTTFLEPNGQRIVQIPGYIEKNDFKRLLAFVKGKYYKTMNLKEFLRKHARIESLQERPEALKASCPVRQGQIVNGHTS
jgi:thioredoxin-related protein